ncbi:MAG TPA: TonB-dependent receptor [Zeimonas sp.]|nr:TonB-dependent receptor [Zeimonas sp.]
MQKNHKTSARAAPARPRMRPALPGIRLQRSVVSHDASLRGTRRERTVLATTGVPLFAFAAAWLALAAPSGARAQPASTSVDPGEAPPLLAQAGGEASASLESVVVTATRSPAAALNVPASVTVVDDEQIELRDPVRLGDALADVPGLYIRGAAMGATFPGSGQAVLSLRGIPRTPRTLVLIDGQPLNNALTGGINVAGIPFDSIERVEIVRGPYSALYGGASMGGVINFISAGPDDPLTELRAGVGSLRQRGASIVHRRRYEGGLGVSMSVAYRESEGEPDSDPVVQAPTARVSGTPVPVTGARPTRDPSGEPRYWVGLQGARPWSQSNAQLSLHYSPTPVTDLIGGVGWADYSVGYSRPTSFLRDAAGNPVFFGPVSFFDGGALQRLSLPQTAFFTPTPSGERDRRVFARATHRFDGGSRLSAQLGVLRHDFAFAQATPGVAGFASGPGDLTDQPNRRIDGEASLRTPMSDRWALVGGVAFNRSRLDRTNSVLSRWRDEDTVVARSSSDGGRSNNLAVFAQSEHYFDNGVTAYLGGRYDRFETEGFFADFTTTPVLEQRFAKRSFHEFSPKLALVWEARPGLSLRTSYGEGFRPPALFDLYGRSVIRTGGPTIEIAPAPDLIPEKVRAFEVGADLAWSGGRRVSVTVYRQRLEDLIYLRTLASTPLLSRRQNGNVAEADVDGIEASVRWPTPWKGLHAFASLTHHFRFEVASNDAVPEMVGKKLTDVPRTSWSAGLEYRSGPWSGLLVVRHVDHVFGSGDDLNTDRVQGVFTSFDAFTVAAARLSWQIDRHWGLNFAVDNLTDREYFVFTRQPGRTFYGELVYRF